jgi:hypothetical protein
MLRFREVEFLRVDNSSFPAYSEISVSYSPAGNPRRILRMDGQEIDLNTITAAWYRRPGPPIPHSTIVDAAVRSYVEEEAAFFLRDLWQTLQCKWIPATEAYIHHAEHKTTQLELAIKIGFQIPSTLVTNSKKDVIDFFNLHNGNVVSKVFRHNRIHPDNIQDECLMTFTEVISIHDLGYCDTIAYCPVIFQAYVPKLFEVRVTVVGTKVFAAEIHSQQTNHTRYDWRHYDVGYTPHKVHVLPMDVHQKCIMLVQKLGLLYGTIDLIVTPERQYVFLEINPNGQYCWIEDLTGLPISHSLCDLLVSFSTAKLNGTECLMS